MSDEQLYRREVCWKCEGSGGRMTNEYHVCGICQQGYVYVPVATVRDLCPCEGCRAATGRG